MPFHPTAAATALEPTAQFALYYIVLPNGEIHVSLQVQTIAKLSFSLDLENHYIGNVWASSESEALKAAARQYERAYGSERI